MRLDIQLLIESIRAGDGHVVVDLPLALSAPARRDASDETSALVAILFVLGTEMYECSVTSTEALDLVGLGARLTTRAQATM